MAHRSRLCALLFDGGADTHERSITFWSSALGRAILPRDSPDSAYASLARDPHLALDLMVQRVPIEETGLHVDIETDDVEAEATRLERLGARRVKRVNTWWVMEAPTGHRFCVVCLQRGPLGDDANVWP